MTLYADVFNSLNCLPCFNDIKGFSFLTDGLSQTAIKVNTATQTFFAKKLNEETASTEIFCAVLCAADSSGQVANHPLSPSVIYHDQQWLVTEYITGITLADSNLESEVKMATALSLMAPLHKLAVSLSKQSIPRLDTTQSVKRLLTKPALFLTYQNQILDKLTKYLTSTIGSLIKVSQSPSVLCHGDINFSNILMDNTQTPWLIDFECAHLAPVEFDLAMFIAVNNIATVQISEIVDEYRKLVPSYQPNKKLLTYYILYSFYINGLWYFDNINEDDSTTHLKSFAVEQWSAFDCFAIEHAIPVPNLMSLIDVTN